VPAAVERVLGALGSVAEVADTDTGTRGAVGKAARTDIGPEEPVEEAELTHTYHRTGRSHQVADHTSCTASSSALLEIRPRPSLLCLCSCHVSSPWDIWVKQKGRWPSPWLETSERPGRRSANPSRLVPRFMARAAKGICTIETDYSE
jgi:hypothetical protein